MIGLRRIEGLERSHVGDDPFREDSQRVQLRDVRRGDAFLLLVSVKNGGTVRRADVGALPVELGRIVNHGEEDAEKLTVSDA